MAERTTTRNPIAGGADEAPPVIPGFELLRRIGQGSYGEVWLARDSNGAFVAVKVVCRQTFEHDRPYDRELSGIRKFEPVSRSHPSQLAILCLGEEPEYFYYVMELADDESAPFEDPGLATAGPIQDSASSPARSSRIDPATYVPRTLKSEVKKRGALPFADCVAIGGSLATALEHLHQHGLIHRDIKPSNVIFVRGVPKLADIGLVTDMEGTISYVGTEGFLPPEGPGTPAADVYSLGKVLYEMVTGRDRMEFPELPTLFDEHPNKAGLLELNLVCLKACQNNPAERYRSAAAMAADLALLQSGRSLREARERERRLRRVRQAVALTAALTVVVFGAMGLLRLYERRELRHRRLQQEQTNQLALAMTQQSREQLAGAWSDRAEQLEARGDLAEGLVWLSQAWLLNEDAPAQAAVYQMRGANALVKIPALVGMFFHAAAVRDAIFSPDGQRVATASDDRTARIWDLSTGEPAGPPLLHSNPVVCVRFSPGSDQLVTGGADGSVRVWNARTFELVAGPLFHGSRVREVRFSPNGLWVMSRADDERVRIWDTSNGRLRADLAHRAAVSAAVLTPDGRRIATADASPAVQIWDAVSGAPLGPAWRQEGAVSGLGFSPDGRRLAVAAGESARIWNVDSGEPASFVVRHGTAVSTVEFSPDGRYLLTLGSDSTARVWDALTGRPFVTSRLQVKTIEQAFYSPDGVCFATVGSNYVQLWNAKDGEAMGSLRINCPITRAAFSDASDALLLAGSDGITRVFSQWAPRPFPETAQAMNRLAQLLSGRRVDEKSRRGVNVKTEALRLLWGQSRSAPNSDPGLRWLWHEKEADRAMLAQDWFAAQFHWDRLLAARPQDSVVRARRDSAARSRIAAQEVSQAASLAPAHISSRPADTSTNLLDLSSFYNAALTESWLTTNRMGGGNDLAQFPQGFQKHNGVEFDARGVIQLSGSALENAGLPYPRAVRDIPIRGKCKRLHFLQGTALSALYGTRIGGYVIHYANGDSREIKLVFGENVRDWWFVATQPQLTAGAAVAWQGQNGASRAAGMSLRVYQMTWRNPLPDLEVASMDFYSTLEKSAPFLLAITRE